MWSRGCGFESRRSPRSVRVVLVETPNLACLVRFGFCCYHAGTAWCRLAPGLDETGAATGVRPAGKLAFCYGVAPPPLPPRVRRSRDARCFVCASRAGWREIYVKSYSRVFSEIQPLVTAGGAAESRLRYSARIPPLDHLQWSGGEHVTINNNESDNTMKLRQPALPAKQVSSCGNNNTQTDSLEIDAQVTFARQTSSEAHWR